ncbi:MAG: NERD domain-containing protein, partial [Candidatus Sumerlaeia bacterium]|nr:NERD domain-containing protein [Candidatus Sumerlaeia bacterium]
VLYRSLFCLRRGGLCLRENEIDFLVILRERGIVAIEAKGGRINVAGGKWTSTDRNGVTHDIQNPGDQVSRACHDLVSKLKSFPKWQTFPVEVGYCVILPDCVVENLKCPSIPKGCLIDESRLDQIFGFIDSVYNAHQKTRQLKETINEERFNILVENFAPTWETKVPNLLRCFRDGENHVTKLSEQQFMFLDFIRDHTRGRIMGQAGTGKSILALEAARRFSNRGMRTLYVCFNRALAGHLRATIGDSFPLLEIYTYHHLCAEFAERYSTPLPDADTIPSDQHEEFFGREHTNALLRALDNPESEAHRFDAIVVDEAQDFRDNWWESLQFILKDHENGAMYIFHDDSQGIFRDPPKFLQEIIQLGRLDRNYRNAIPIHDLMKRRFDVKTVACGPVSNTEVQWREMQPDQKAPSAVARSLKHLIEEERIPPGEIAVLTGCSLQRTPLGNDHHIGGFRITDDPTDPNRVLLSTIHAFKGLDRAAIILCELDSLLDKKREGVLYVGVSRARQYLEVVGTAEVIGNLRDSMNA